MTESLIPEKIHAFLEAEPLPAADMAHPEYIRDSIHVLTNWFLTCDHLFPKRSSERAETILGFRCVWIFPNGWALATSEEAPLTIAHQAEPTSPEDATVSDALAPEYNYNEWHYSPAINGWRRTENLAREEHPDFLPQLLIHLTKKWGTPTLTLPWLNYIEFATDDPETLEDRIAEAPEEIQPTLHSTLRLLQSANDDTLQNRLPWETNTFWGTDGLPKWSSAGRIWQLADELEDTGTWIVSLDEHCGACFGGEVTQFTRMHPDVTDYHTFITWGQSSYGEWEQDGSTSVEIIISTEEEGAALLPYLIKYGFVLEEDLEDMTENGTPKMPRDWTLAFYG